MCRQFLRPQTSAPRKRLAGDTDRREVELCSGCETTANVLLMVMVMVMAMYCVVLYCVVPNGKCRDKAVGLCPAFALVVSRFCTFF